MPNAIANHLSRQNAGRILWIDYLRSFITILVVAHHSSLAYTTFAYFNKDAYILSSAPVVDVQRTVGLDIFENFNDVFFYGTDVSNRRHFCFKKHQKKGRSQFLKDRFYRLFIPFTVAVTTLMLLAYFPSFRLAHPKGDIRQFIIDFFLIEQWPPGPPWFIWVLFLFNGLISLTGNYGISVLTAMGMRLQKIGNRPFYIIFVFFLTCWMLYVPASWIFGAYTWTGFGPFDFQKSRLLLYFAFFLFGCTLGFPDPNQGIFEKNSSFVRRWPVWLSGCLLFYGLVEMSAYKYPHGTGPAGLGAMGDQLVYRTIYTLSTCFSTLAFLSMFRRFIIRSGKIWDSLCENAYCIYLVHYIFVTWIQYALLDVRAPAIVKFSLTFIFSLLFSWAMSILLRKITFIKNYV